MDNKIRQYLDKECPYCNGKIKKQENGSETEYLCSHCGRIMKKQSEFLQYDIFLKYVIPCRLLVTLFTRDSNGHHWDIFIKRFLISIPVFLALSIIFDATKYIFGDSKRIK